MFRTLRSLDPCRRTRNIEDSPSTITLSTQPAQPSLLDRPDRFTRLSLTIKRATDCRAAAPPGSLAQRYLRHRHHTYPLKSWFVVDRHAPNSYTRIALYWQDWHKRSGTVSDATWRVERRLHRDAAGDDYDDLVESAEFDDFDAALLWAEEWSEELYLEALGLGIFHSREEWIAAGIPSSACAAASAVTAKRMARRAGRERARDVKDGADLREARETAGLSLAELAASCNLDVDRLEATEQAEPAGLLSFEEWLRIAAVLEGIHRYDGSVRQKIGWVAGSGHMLDAARAAIRRSPTD